MIPWLKNGMPFPPVSQAQSYPNGLLAASEDISAERVLTAYREGIFPWYNVGEPVLWWSPDPRMVLFPHEIKISRSLQKTLSKHHYSVRLDTAFREVISACADARAYSSTSWIQPTIEDVYTELHEMGYAHSVETWVDDELVGGLYGMAIGKIFFGESMFMRQSDASKIAFAHLARYLAENDYVAIDCQMSTTHLASLGAREIPRAEFTAMLVNARDISVPIGKWPAQDAAQYFTE